MEIITKNNRKYYRFKIGDEFKAISGKGSFNKMKKEGLCSDTYNEEQGFIYPFYDGSTINNHVKGYCQSYNFDGKAIKVAKDGAESGKTKYIYNKSFNAGHSYYLVSNNFTNEYLSLFFSNYLPEFQQGTSIPSVKFNDYKDEYIEIPINHEELSRVIKRILEYKQISKQISKQMKDYKLAILQESEKAIKHWKETNQHDKYITFKIGDEFSLKNMNHLAKKYKISSEYKTISWNQVVQNNFIGTKYPFYDNSTSNNHIKGYIDLYNFEGSAIKVSTRGDSGRCILINNKKIFLSGGKGGGVPILLLSKKYTNEFITIFLNKLFTNSNEGSVINQFIWSRFVNNNISIPKNHNELSKKIEQLNEWQIKVEETVKQMEEYIEGILQMSLK